MLKPPKTRRVRRLFGAAARSLAASDTGPHRCLECRRPFMCPIAWEPSGESHWLIQLRCGECGAWREELLTNDEAKAFDLLLDRQIAPMTRALERLDRERMAAEVEVFAEALKHDLLDAADFAR